jgi:hypothetical protein
VIRNVVIHVSNEQPLLADLYGAPTAGDVGLLCTNVRMLDGKRPIFIDHTDSTFFFPYLHLRFLEIPAVEMQKSMAQGGSVPGSAGRDAIAGDTDQRLAVVVAEAPDPVGETAPEPDGDDELDLDEDFLQRIRDI